MMKNVLVISTSLRPHSNSDVLARAFVQGAEEAGHQVEYISLRGKDIHFCRGCYACEQTFQCAVKDDAPAIVEQINDADVIAFATPIYYYEMAGQLKALLDRTVSKYYAPHKPQDIYLLTAAAENEPSTPEGAEHGLQGWIACYDDVRLAGHVFAGGVQNQGDIEGHPAIQKAYNSGKAC